jgi:hypothetical protein
MGQNRVQFQTGLSFEAFIEQYGTEAQCVAAVFGMKWRKGFECAECGHKEKYRVERAGRLLVCTDCHHRNFLTAGTIFQDTKLPLRKWFLAMHLLTRDKQGISALQLKRDMGVSYETAWTVKQKIMEVMRVRVEEKKLEYHAVADDVYIGGKRSNGKRGRGSENKIPVVVAVSLSPDEKPDQMSARQVSGFTLSAIKDWATQNLSKGMSLQTDGLNCFPAVKQAGVKHLPTVISDDLSQQDKGSFHWINTIIGNLKTALTGTYHHVSEKHLSRYLAEFEYRFNRRYDLTQMIPRLLHQAIKTPPFPESVLTYAS